MLSFTCVIQSSFMLCLPGCCRDEDTPTIGYPPLCGAFPWPGGNLESKGIHVESSPSPLSSQSCAQSRTLHHCQGRRGDRSPYLVDAELPLEAAASPVVQRDLHRVVNVPHLVPAHLILYVEPDHCRSQAEKRVTDMKRNGGSMGTSPLLSGPLLHPLHGAHVWGPEPQKGSQPAQEDKAMAGLRGSRSTTSPSPAIACGPKGREEKSWRGRANGARDGGLRGRGVMTAERACREAAEGQGQKGV